MNNYFGIGVDANIALIFHRLREQQPSWFFHRTVNKLWYTHAGVAAQISQSPPLHTHLQLVCDGEPVALPEGTQGLIFCNINSFAGGVKLWSENDDTDSVTQTGLSDSLSVASSANSHPHSLSHLHRRRGDSPDSASDVHVSEESRTYRVERRRVPPSPSDGLIEIVAVFSSFHLGQMQIGLSDSIKVAQCREAKITTTCVLPMEVDGEPHEQPPCTITLKLRNKMVLMARSVAEPDAVKAAFFRVLDEAEASSNITRDQHQFLRHALITELRAQRLTK
eukprot:TRINITY_DN8701_c0_g2_i1.p1 TRINITY_DN8701_c0_g2~~TRINITY_DN8701_c0_g2_i1.p1  ORF type:complete len:279 (+),score=56.53 TRINITY_DN8701_c0_g2_i1:184-1020(+)